jgi:3-phenylpropionate/trans-cinnamate dioxygenase ferredoxin reductase component
LLDRIVIIGAGQAAARAVDTLRQRGYGKSLVVVGDEPHLPYQRPPLSKKYLAGALDRDQLLIRRARHYSEHAVEMRLGLRAVEIDRRAQRVRLSDGSALAYDALLIATGSRPRLLRIPGADSDNVHYVRTIADADTLRAKCEPGRRLVIVGGGYVGLEVAATCRQLGLEVTVLETAERVMQRVVSAEVSRIFAAEHARNGVRISCNTHVSALVVREGTRRVSAVLCDDGSEHPADIVVIGIGVVPEEQLAAAAGLQCSDGIVVDERCRTSDGAIYAAGDCTNHPSVRFGGRVRIESVDNAFEQAATAARNMLGEAAAHDKVPWFWSDQYDLKLNIVGLSGGHCMSVTRGSPASRSFSVCHLRRGELIAMEIVNNPKDQIAARKLVASGMRPDLDKLVDPQRALKDCA